MSTTSVDRFGSQIRQVEKVDSEQGFRIHNLQFPAPLQSSNQPLNILVPFYIVFFFNNQNKTEAMKSEHHSCRKLWADLKK